MYKCFRTLTLDNDRGMHMFKTILMSFLNALLIGPQLVRHEAPGKIYCVTGNTQLNGSGVRPS